MPEVALSPTSYGVLGSIGCEVGSEMGNAALRFRTALAADDLARLRAGRGRDR